MSTEPFVREDVLERIKGWRGYVEAKLGFRNHWYPIRLSSEIVEGQTITVKMLGENLLLKRIEGKVYAIRDRCLHRGVAFSRKLECYTVDTVTCWYHGYTYRFQTGELCSILAMPNSKLVGRRALVTFPVQEAKGIVFVFIGDSDGEPPPLAQDVPPTFLDDDMMVFGKHRVVNSNWRLGAENGFDSLHIYIHRDTMLRHFREMNFPLGHIPTDDKIQTVEAPDGPKGVIDEFKHHTPVWEANIDDKFTVKGVRTALKTTSAAAATSMWLPGVLKVDSFPYMGITQYEWYVPIDEKSHLYFQTLGSRVSSEEQGRQWANDFESKWKVVALDGFNNEDIWAREATEPFYADDYGWLDEMLCEPDNVILVWRELASRLNRGIQRPENLR